MTKTVTHRGVRRLVAVVAGLGFAIGCLLFAPTSVGGAATWVRTWGSSMQPGIHSGDLVIVRPRAAYQVGDVIAYRSGTLNGTTVVHRIVAAEDGAFVTKGDNNDWLDPDRPDPSQVLGVVSVQIPRGGQVLTVFTNPFLILAVALMAGGFGAAAGRSRRRGGPARDRAAEHGARSGEAGRFGRHGTGRSYAGRRSTGDAGDPAATSGSWSVPNSWPVAELAAGAALGSLALAVLGFGQPLHRSAGEQIEVRHSAELSYAAAVKGAKAAAVYPGGLLRTGDPVFLSLAPVLDTTLRYRLQAPAVKVNPADVSGTVRSLARITTGNGWDRTVVLAPPREFTGAQVEQSAKLDFPALRRAVAAAENAAGSSFGGITVTVVHEVDLDATIAGQPLQTTYRPELSFTLDSTQAMPSAQTLPSTPGVPSAAAVPAGAEEFVSLSKTTSVPSTKEAAATVNLLRWDVPVLLVRVLAVALAAASLALASLALARRRRPAPEVPFGGRLLHASHIDLGASSIFVDLDDTATLADFAERHDLTVVHVPGPETDLYLAVHEDTVYRHTKPNITTASQAPHGRIAVPRRGSDSTAESSELS